MDRFFKYAFVGLVAAMFLLPVASSLSVSFTFSGSTVPSKIEAGDSGNLLLKITNSGTVYAKNVKLSLKPNPYVTMDKTSFDLQTVDAGKAVELSIPVTVSSGIPQTVTTISFTASYEEGDSTGTRTVEGSVSIQVLKKAIVSIGSVEYSDQVIEPGDSFQLSFNVENNGKSSVKNLMVSLRNLTSFIVPVGSSDSYVGSISPGSSKKVTFDLSVNNDAKISSYTIPIGLVYYDDDEVKYDETKYIGLKVSGRQEFLVTLDAGGKTFSGDISKVTITIANRGTADARFLSVQAESALPLLQKEVYVGTLESDDFDTVIFDADLTAVQEGEYPITLKLVYEDSYNQQLSESETVSLKVFSMPFDIPMYLQIIIALAVLFALYKARKLFMKKR